MSLAGLLPGSAVAFAAVLRLRGSPGRMPGVSGVTAKRWPRVLSPDSGLMEKGVIVRHLLLPGCAGDSKRIPLRRRPE